MKVTKELNGKTVYLACAYMLNTKNEDYSVLRYGNSSVYDNTHEAYQDGFDLVKEAYNRIKSGEITFPCIPNFDKNKVFMEEFEFNGCNAVVYKNDDGTYEWLCSYNIEELTFHVYNNTECIVYTDGDTTHSLVKYGKFWYLICNIHSDVYVEFPCIAKKFWWFTGLDRMIYYMLNKFENMAI